MSLSDMLDGAGKASKAKPAAAIAIKVAPVSHAVDDAAAHMLKAIHSSDAAGLADAIRMAVHACMDEYENDDKGAGGDSDAGES